MQENVTQIAQLDRPLARSIKRGIFCKCPHCGDGKIFDGFLKVVDQCEQCGEDLSHHRADDLPAYLNILLVGHVVIGFMIILMSWNLLSMWQMTFATAALCLSASFLLMRPIKGMIVSIQWALSMHGFGGHED